MDEALRAYWSPVYAYIRRTGKSRADAEELTQEFVRQVVLGRGLFARADSEKAKFRTFLRAALRNFLVDMATSKAAKARQLERPTGGDGVGGGFPEPAETDDPDLAFDRQWAAGLLSAALDRTRGHCEQSGMYDHWRLFEAAYIEPLRRGAWVPTHTPAPNPAPNPTPSSGPDVSSPPPGVPASEVVVGASMTGHAGQALAMGLDPSKAESMVQTVRRVFRRNFRAVVAETVKETGEAGGAGPSSGTDRVEEEIRYVFKALGLVSGGA